MFQYLRAKGRKKNGKLGEYQKNLNDIFWFFETKNDGNNEDK